MTLLEQIKQKYKDRCYSTVLTEYNYGAEQLQLIPENCSHKLSVISGHGAYASETTVEVAVFEMRSDAFVTGEYFDDDDMVRGYMSLEDVDDLFNKVVENS